MKILQFRLKQFTFIKCEGGNIVGNKKILIIAVILAVVFVGLLQLYLSGVKKEYSAGMSFVDIVVATKNIPAHSVVTPKMVSVRQFPEKYVHKEAIRSKDKGFVVGQPTSFKISKGQPFLWTDFAGTKQSIGLSGVITSEDERALSIPVSEISGVGYLLKPDDHVDIIGTFVNPKDGQTTTLTLLQNVTILAVGENLGASSESKNKKQIARRTIQDKYRSITLLVSPEEAELLIFAQIKGRITLMLRKDGATKIDESIPEMNFNRIFVPEVRKSLQKRRNARIEIIGSKR